MPEKIQLLRQALVDYLITMSAQDPAVLVCIMCQSVVAIEFSYGITFCTLTLHLAVTCEYLCWSNEV